MKNCKCAYFECELGFIIPIPQAVAAVIGEYSASLADLIMPNISSPHARKVTYLQLLPTRGKKAHKSRRCAHPPPALVLEVPREVEDGTDERT